MEKYNLNRFLRAQATSYEVAYYELSNGKKESHWMWYIFPQIFGLGKSDTAIYYSLNSLDEAKQYLNHEILGSRLIVLVDILLGLETNDPVEVFYFPDNLKLWSSMTLFMYADETNPKFKQVLDKYFQGRIDMATYNILKDNGEI